MWWFYRNYIFEIFGKSNTVLITRCTFLFYSITNLKFWGHSEIIIRKTLNLLNELSVSYSWVRKLVKLDEIQFLLNNHTVRICSSPFGQHQNQNFWYFKRNGNFICCRVNTSPFWVVMLPLAKCDAVVCFIRHSGDCWWLIWEKMKSVSIISCYHWQVSSLKLKFAGRFFIIIYFLFQFLDQFESIGGAIMDTSTYPSEEAKKALIGLSRDLRGLTFSSSKKNAYMMFFDWM